MKRIEVRIRIILHGALVFFFLLGNASAQSFTKYFIDDNLAWASGVATSDVDGDLDIDVVATGATANEVAWYENDGAQNFTKHVVDSTLGTARSCYGIDVDQDTDVDIIAAASGADSIVWYENDGAQNFTPHLIVDGLGSAWDVFVVDLDLDNDLDVVATAANDNVVNWYENDGAQNFGEHNIDPYLDGAEGIYAIDLDGDSDIDVVACGIFGDEVVWYENDSSQNFTEHVVDPSFNGVNDVFIGDMDMDGDYDIVASGSQDNQVKWYENDGFQNFTGHVVANLQGARAVFVAHINSDTLPDIAAVSLLDVVMWYENSGGGNFVPHVIDNFLDLAFGLYVADLDGDSDLDVLATGGSANDLVWYESDLVGVAENEYQKPILCEVIRLHNSPNPFTAHTTFYFDIRKPSSITLGIFDISGQLIQTLTQQSQGAGHIEMAWDRRDAQGYRVPAGIYFYRVETVTSSGSGHMCVID